MKLWIRILNCSLFLFVFFFLGISSFVTQPSPVVVNEGSVARFVCSVNANPPAKITWEFNQKVLPLETERY